ncbi:MAG: VanZ family protein [Candidatus Celaenobacter antarcticus]|nr:VanZ family protein [Candidatus Celaenobacter antarcticus]
MKRNVHSPYFSGINLVLYSLLLIATPFLLIQNYLQQAIGMASDLSFNVWKLEVPYILAIAIIFVIAILVVFRHKITHFRIFACIVVILMVILGQHSTDYYFHHKFYELQHNWHYIAYGIFAYIIYRFLKEKELPSEWIILSTFITALSVSAFDETIQIFISSRIFDICDVAKDAWGTIMGMVVVFFVIESGQITRNGWKLRQKKVRDYLKNPFSLLFLEVVFAYLFLLISSILSNKKYLSVAILLSIGVFLIFFLVFHNSQKKVYRNIFISIAIILVAFQSFFFIKYYNGNIIYNTKGLIVYKGIPIPYFDIMIYPNGTFRLVDKKTYFINPDKYNTIYPLSKDILLIGSGSDGKGGKGFPEDKEAQFVFNPKTKLPLQIIILKNKEACERFNELKKKGYSVLYIIHNS